MSKGTEDDEGFTRLATNKYLHNSQRRQIIGIRVQKGRLTALRVFRTHLLYRRFTSPKLHYPPR